MHNKGTVLLTGASGFIGGHLAALLLQEGYEVYAPLRPDAYDKIAPLRSYENFHPLNGLFYDAALLENIQESVDFVLHAAAIRGGGRADKAAYRLVNVQATKTLLDFARSRKVKGFLYLSTVGVLGTIPQSQPASEENPEAPDGIYHQTKWQAEELVRKYAHKGLNTIILRPTITYGTGDDGFIPKLWSLVRSGKMFLPASPVYIHLLSVQALSRLIKSIVQNKLFNGKTYIIADKVPVELQAIAERFARSGGKYRSIPKAVFRVADILLAALGRQALRTSIQLISRDWTYDITATVRDLPYEPSDTLTQLQRLTEEYESKNS